MQGAKQRGKQRKSGAPSAPNGGGPQRAQLPGDPGGEGEEPEEEITLTRAELQTLTDKAKNSGRMQGLAARRWSKEPRQDDDEDGDGAGLEELRFQNKVLRQLVNQRELQARLYPTNGRDEELLARIAQLEEEKRQAAFDAKLGRLEAKIEGLSSRNNDGAGGGLEPKEILSFFIDMAKVVRDQTPKPEVFLESVKKYAEGYGAWNETKLKSRELEIRAEMLKLQREEERERRLDQIRREMAEAQHGRDTFMEIGHTVRDMVDKAVTPVTTALSEGLRDRFSRAGAAPTAQQQMLPPDYSKLGPQEFEIVRTKMGELKLKVALEEQRILQEEERRRLVQAQQQARPTPPPQPLAPPETFRCMACGAAFPSEASRAAHEGQAHGGTA